MFQFIKYSLSYSGNMRVSWTRSDMALIAGMTLAALLLRLPGLDQGLWFDEVVTLIRYVRLPVSDIVAQSGNLNNHVLYTLSAHVTTGWFGESAWSLRLPAVVFGVATIPVLYYFARQVTSRREALLATVFLLASYHHVWYSQNARGYTGLALGALLSSILFIRLISSTAPRSRDIIGYAVVAALTSWIHLTGASLIITHGIIWLILALQAVRQGRRSTVLPVGQSILLAGLFVLVLYSPLLVEMAELVRFSETVQSEQVVADYIKEFIKSGKGARAGWTLKEFTLGVSQGIPGGLPMLLAVIAVLLAGVVSYARQGVTVTGLLLFPAIIILTVIFSRKIMFYPRFVFIALPCILLLAVRGGFVLSRLFLPFLSSRRVLIVGLFVALATLSKVPDAWKPKQDFAAAARFLADHRLPGDAVGCLRLVYSVIHRFWGVDCERVSSVSTIERMEATHERIWILYSLPKFQGRFRNGIFPAKLSEYDHVKDIEGSVNGGNIVIMLKHNNSSPGQENPVKQ